MYLALSAHVPDGTTSNSRRPTAGADMRAELLRQGLLDARASRDDSAGIGGVSRGDGAGRVGEPGPDLRWLEDLHPATGRE